MTDPTARPWREQIRCLMAGDPKHDPACPWPHPPQEGPAAADAAGADGRAARVVALPEGVTADQLVPALNLCLRAGLIPAEPAGWLFLPHDAGEPVRLSVSTGPVPFTGLVDAQVGEIGGGRGVLGGYEVGISGGLVFTLCRRCPHIMILGSGIGEDGQITQRGLTVAELGEYAMEHERDEHPAVCGDVA